MSGAARRTPPKFPRPTPVPRVRSALVDELAPGDLEGFWAGPGSRLPIIEPDTDGHVVVTFCWRDADAESVLLFANRLTDETHLADTLLERKPGTDLWHASYRMSTRWRASYAFLVQRRGETAPWMLEDQVSIRATLDRGHSDPRNPVTCRNRAGVVQSVAEGPDAPAQPWLMERPIPKGTVTATVGPGDREVWTYAPPGVGPDVVLPLLVVLDGEVWVGNQSLPTTLDNLLVDGEIEPVRAVLLASGGREARWQGMSGEGGETAYVADELVPWMRERGGVAEGPEAVVAIGQSLGGLSSLRLVLTRTDVVGCVVSHSASLWQDPLLDLAPSGPARIHLAHGAQEWVLTGDHERLAEHLRTLAAVELDVSVHDGGHDYAWWRGGVADGIRWVLSRQPGVGGVQR